MKEVVIIGASGHGKVIADIVASAGDKVVGFLDDNPNINVLGKVSDYPKFSDKYFIIAIGNADVRQRIANEITVKWYTAVHATAVVSPSAEIGDGTVVMPNVVINASTKIGVHCIINTGAIIEHDNKIGDYSHVSVGSRIGGTVTIGSHSWIGIGSTLSNNVTICDRCTIGAGSVVVRDILEQGTYVGVPAKKI